MAEQTFRPRLFRVSLVAMRDTRREGRTPPRRAFTRLFCCRSLAGRSRSAVLGMYTDVSDDADTGQLNINGLKLERLFIHLAFFPYNLDRKSE